MPCRLDALACLIAHVLPHLLRVIDSGGGQYYACCPAHDDRHASFGIRDGDRGARMIWWCHAQPQCDVAAIREALIGAGVSEGCLGTYGSARWLASAARRNASLDAALRRIADLEAKLEQIAGLLADDKLTGTLRQVLIRSVIEGGEIPKDEPPFIELAERAGLKHSSRYNAYSKYLTL